MGQYEGERNKEASKSRYPYTQTSIFRGGRPDPPAVNFGPGVIRGRLGGISPFALGGSRGILGNFEMLFGKSWVVLGGVEMVLGGSRGVLGDLGVLSGRCCGGLGDAKNNKQEKEQNNEQIYPRKNKKGQKTTPGRRTLRCVT